MPTTAGTTARGLAYPGDTSTADLPAQMKALADSIEAMMNSALVLGSSLAVPGDILATGGVFQSSVAGGGYLWLVDSTAGADLKRSRLKTGVGITALESRTDALGAKKTGLTMDHASGAVDFPNGLTASGAPVVTPEAAFSTYKTLHQVGGFVKGDQATAGTYGLGGRAWEGLNSALSLDGYGVFYFDPADFTAGSRTTKLRLRVALMTNATAPAATFTVGLYPVSAVAGGTFISLTATLGTVVAGSSVTFTTPSASTRSQGNSGDFPAPAAGFYVLGVVLSATPAGPSSEAINATLQLRQV